MNDALRLIILANERSSAVFFNYTFEELAPSKTTIVFFADFPQTFIE
jgi:hypothetical protein